MKGYLDSYHYNFRCPEKRHYYSSILKHAIIISRFPQICHRIRMDTAWAQLQAYTKTYTSSQPLSLSLTHGPHMSSSSSFPPHLPLLSASMASSSSSSTRPGGARGLGGSRLDAAALLLLASPPAHNSRSRARPQHEIKTCSTPTREEWVRTRDARGRRARPPRMLPSRGTAGWGPTSAGARPSGGATG